MGAISKFFDMVGVSKVDMPVHRVVLLEGGRCPSKYLMAVGADVCVNDDVLLLPGKPVVVGLGFRVEPADGYYVELVARSSSLASKNCYVAIGVIDPDYRGEVKVSLVNLGRVSVMIKRGERVAQLVTRRFYDADYVVVDCLSDTVRGNSGFGSSGK